MDKEGARIATVIHDKLIVARAEIASLEAELAEANGLLDEIDKTISDNPGEWAEFYTMNIEDILAKQKGGE